MLVTPKLRDQYERDGYLIFDPEVPETILDGVIDDVKDKYGTSDLEVFSPDNGRIQDAWRISANVKALALAPKALGLLEELYDCKPLPFQTLDFRVGTEQHPHSDAMFFNSMPSGYMCGIWVALENVDLDNGPLVYYPGSHKLPELTVQHINKAIPPPADIYTTDDLCRRYQRIVDSRIARFELQPKYGVIEKGKAILWSSNLLHGGAPQNDKSRTRHSHVTHYFFEGCQYYTPLHSWGAEVYWRNPTWIRNETTPGSELAPTLVAPAYEGCHDLATSKVICGWAWNRNRPNCSVSVDVFADRDLLATVLASEFRPDLQPHTKDNGCHGFMYRTPSHLARGKAHRITVKISETEVVLANSPQRIADS
jgi:hypothetical protein